MQEPIIPFLIALSVAATLAPFNRWLAVRHWALDSPDSRKAHKRAGSRTGALCIAAVVVGPLVVLLAAGSDLAGRLVRDDLQMRVLVLGGLVIAILGGEDDARSLKVRTQILLQLLVSRLYCVLRLPNAVLGRLARTEVSRRLRHGRTRFLSRLQAHGRDLDACWAALVELCRQADVQRVSWRTHGVPDADCREAVLLVPGTREYDRIAGSGFFTMTASAAFGAISFLAIEVVIPQKLQRPSLGLSRLLYLLAAAITSRNLVCNRRVLGRWSADATPSS